MPLMATSPNVRAILGLMTFGPDPEAGARITSLDEYGQCLDYFQAMGYNEIDTARVYVGGKQEAFTRKAGWKERGLAIATKWYPHEAGAHMPGMIEAKLNESLEELGTDCVDIFYLHAADRSVPFELTLQACNELHEKGKFVRLGLSNFTAFEVAEVVMTCRQHGWVRPSVYQGMYNAITRNLATEAIPACHRYGLDVVVYNPLAGGLLSGKIKSSEVPDEGRFSDAAKSGALYRRRYFNDKTFKALSIFERVVEKHCLTMTEVALRWCIHHSELKVTNGHDGIILGVSSFSQLKENLAALEKGPLPEEVVKALDESWQVVKGTSAPYWHLDLKYTYDTVQALFPAKSEA